MQIDEIKFSKIKLSEYLVDYFTYLKSTPEPIRIYLIGILRNDLMDNMRNAVRSYPSDDTKNQVLDHQVIQKIILALNALCRDLASQHSNDKIDRCLKNLLLPNNLNFIMQFKKSELSTYLVKYFTYLKSVEKSFLQTSISILCNNLIKLDCQPLDNVVLNDVIAILSSTCFRDFDSCLTHNYYIESIRRIFLD